MLDQVRSEIEPYLNNFNIKEIKRILEELRDKHKLDLFYQLREYRNLKNAHKSYIETLKSQITRKRELLMVNKDIEKSLFVDIS